MLQPIHSSVSVESRYRGYRCITTGVELPVSMVSLVGLVRSIYNRVAPAVPTAVRGWFLVILKS